jgi:Trp operon repressor
MHTEAGESVKVKMGWVAKTCITIVTIAVPVLGNAVMEWKTDIDKRVEDVEKGQPAAFHVIYENEQANLRQWQQLSKLGTTTYSNEKRMAFYELLLVGDHIDVERLEAALRVVEAMKNSGLTAGEIETSLNTMQKIKGLNPFASRPVPTAPKPSIRPNVQQMQSQKPALLSPAELQRYIESKKGGTK